MLYIIHENDEWLPPFRETFRDAGLAVTEWHMARYLPDLSEEPPQGIFYVRMSASAHTRGHRGGPELTSGVLCWLERHGRRVINGSQALDLELSKLRQYEALQRHDLRVPQPAAARDPEQLLHLAQAMPGSFITKHNRSGMGLGVQWFEDLAAFEARLKGGETDPPIDGVTLIQQYIDSPDPLIIRCEFIGGSLVYAVRVDTSQGFQLCPADVCAVEDQPVSEATGQRPLFEIIPTYSDPILGQYEAFLSAHSIDVAGIEFITDHSGRKWTYDVNVNTNYNSEAEERAGVDARAHLARFLQRELACC